MNSEAQGSWQLLREAGLVADSAAPQQTAITPWYVRLMLGFAGWIAAMFLLGFVARGLSWMIENEMAMLFTGLLMIGIAWLMLRRLGLNDFAAQFALAISFAGQALFAFGLYGLLGDDTPRLVFWLVMAALQALLAGVMPNTIHRLWSAFATGVSLFLALQATPINFAASAMILALAARVWTCEFRWPRKCSIVRPLAYGLVLALLAADLAAGLFRPALGLGPETLAETPLHPWAAQFLNGAVLLWVVWRLLRHQGLVMRDRAAILALLGTIALVLVSLKAPGIAIGLCITLLGFAHSNRTLTAVGILALLLYAGGYYYSLEATLLVKSQALAATGVVVLFLRWLMLRFLAGKSEAKNETD